MNLPMLVITALVLMTASTGAIFKPGAWYASLDRPAWTPPNWLFPIVWTVLYVLIGIAGWRAWQAGETVLIALWLVQLAANAAWSWLFFGRRNMRQAMVDVVVLLATVIAFIAAAAATLPSAAALFVPYALWVATAATLNWQMIKLNPHRARGER
ncbi:MAG: TspO/MBR family protein [Pseudomonadota bacterium]